VLKIKSPKLQATSSVRKGNRREAGSKEARSRFNRRNSYFGSLGLSESVRPPKPNSIERARYGPVCPVVWEGRCREASPYRDLGSI
jgi:hypothetical protein